MSRCDLPSPPFEGALQSGALVADSVLSSLTQHTPTAAATCDDQLRAPSPPPSR